MLQDMPANQRRKYLILNGPNINLLGTRQPEIYGTETLKDLETLCVDFAKREGVEVVCEQTNHEGEIIDLLQKAQKEGYSGVVVNPGGYSHTSVAILDACLCLTIPIVEVHISNVHRREKERNVLCTAKGTQGVITGFGLMGYVAALYLLAKVPFMPNNSNINKI